MAKLFVNKEHAVVTTNTELFCWNWNNLESLGNSSVKIADDTSDDHSIDCASFSENRLLFVTCSKKTLKLWNTKTWTSSLSCTLAKRANGVRFFPKKNYIVVADTSGDAWFYSFSDTSIERLPNHILGHNSTLLDVLVSEDEKYVITNDRDEKIRVSLFPNTYNILSYCLGHECFVINIRFLPSDKNILVSSGGDGLICLWDYKKGKNLIRYPTRSFVPDSLDQEIVGLSGIKDSWWPITALECSSENSTVVIFLLFKVRQINLLNIQGDLSSGLTAGNHCIIKLDSIPLSIDVHQDIIFVLMQGNKSLLRLWKIKSYSELVTEETSNCDLQLLFQNWKNCEISVSNNDMKPVLYKKEYDNVGDYLSKKRARLSKPQLDE